MKYLVKTELGDYLFDQDFNYIDTNTKPVDLGSVYVSIDQRHLFCEEDLEDHALQYCEKDVDYAVDIQRALVSAMVDNSVESLIAAESIRLKYGYYAKIKQKYPKVMNEILNLVKKKLSFPKGTNWYKELAKIEDSEISAGGAVNFNNTFDKIEEDRKNGVLRNKVVTDSFWYEEDKDNYGCFIRVTSDGKKTSGKFINGKFVPST